MLHLIGACSSDASDPSDADTGSATDATGGDVADDPAQTDATAADADTDAADTGADASMDASDDAGPDPDAADVLDPGETCDDGDGNPFNTCPNTCIAG